MSTRNDGAAYDGSVSLWHPWNDKQGYRHPLATWDSRLHTISTLEASNLFQVSNVDEMFQTVGKHRLMAFCDDILDETCIPFGHELIGHPNAKPYLSRSGKISALRLSQKRGCGFLIPTFTWGYYNKPDKRMIENVFLLFHLFGYESTTPASLSEKVLRSTLPEKVIISRPSAGLRRDILENNQGGRIDKAKKSDTLYRLVKVFDECKAYLHHSRQVPSPFISPVIRFHPSVDEALSYAEGWWHCRILAHEYQGIAPLQVNGDYPVEGEVLDLWLWTCELSRCLEYGYELLEISYGYGFLAMSNFMEEWSNILWEKWERAKTDDPHVQKMIKQMMVGLPGRFLRQPETYELKHRSEAKKGDIPITFNWKNAEDRKFSDYVVRPVYDHECTALSPVGSYIQAAMRCDLYDIARDFEKNGYMVIRTYVDSIAIDFSLARGDYHTILPLGNKPGQWKETEYRNVYAEENRFIGRNNDPYAWPEDEMKAPGFSRERRLLFWRKYRRLLENAST